MLFGGVLSIRRVRGWVGAEPIRPQASAWGYPEPQLRSSIRMACRGRLDGLPTSTAASQLSRNPRHCNGERAYLFGMKRLQKSAEGSFPGMATKGTKTQKELSDRQDSKSSHSFCAFCAFCGECRSYQPITFAAFMSFAIGNFANGAVDNFFFAGFQQLRKAGRSLWCKVRFQAAFPSLAGRFSPSIRGGFP